MGKVSVNRGLLAGLAAVAVAALLAVAFLLGRASGSGTPAGAAEAGRGPRAREEAPRPTARMGDPAPESGSGLPAAVSAPAPSEIRAGLEDLREATPGPSPASTLAGRGAPGPDPVRAEVAAYFGAVDNIQPGRLGDSAEGMANEMAAALGKGDFSSLDEMVRRAEAAKDRLAALTPPAPCAAYHREGLRSLDDAVETLRALKKALESPDPASQLAGFTARAESLRASTEALQREEAALRRRYGLAR
jgi:hypothetical protein